jgi:hypothetical protein
MALGKMTLRMPLVLAGAYSCNYVLQDTIGSDDDFFDGRYITKKDPDDIAEFYTAEDLLKIISIFPFIFEQVMNKVIPDEHEATKETALLSVGETHFNTKFVGMEVSFEITEHEEEKDDGEAKLFSFLRHERFIDWVPFVNDYGVKLLMWDQTWKYGFNTLEDGKVEVYHQGERFLGPWPVRIIVMIHQRYVLWACEKYINGDAFGTDDIDKQLEQMANVPLWRYRQFMATLRAEKEKALEAKKKEAKQDLEAIAKAEADVAQLKKLEMRTQAPIAIAKRPGAVLPVGGPFDF